MVGGGSFGFFIFILFSLYLFFQEKKYDPIIANKAFAQASLALLALVLLSGVLSRLYNRFDSWVMYRKEFGIVCFFLALAHGLISLFFLPERFNLAYFKLNWFAFALGLGGMILLTYLFFISFQVFIEKLGRKRWWQHQVWGARLAGFFVFFHMLTKEYHEWGKWLKTGGENLSQHILPPLSLLVGAFGIFVILVRISEFLGQKIAQKVTILLFACLILFLTFSLFLKNWV